MAECSGSPELETDLYLVDAANGLSIDNKRSLSPMEDYNPLEDCT